jgi:GntR family transcriptional regulator
MERNHTRNYKHKLLYEMKEGKFSASERLPRETELAEMLGISRTQLRDTLSELEREGYITRRHGVGTIINRHVLQVSNRMDIETEFCDIVRSCGCTPAVRVVWVKEAAANSRVAAKLGIPEGSTVLCKCSVCLADGVPAICWVDVLDKALVKHPYTPEDFGGVIFDFLHRFCEVSAYMDLTELRAVAANEAVATCLGVPAGTPLLNMEEVDFDIEGKPIFYSDQYFVDGPIHHTVLRKKL